MIHEMMLLSFLQASVILAAPLQFPSLQPLQGTLQQQQLALQEQMFALQQFQALQRFNAVPSPVAVNSLPPLLLLFPSGQSNIEQSKRYTKLNENFIKSNQPSEIENGDPDSITIDAEPQQTIDRIEVDNSHLRAILLVPNSARFSLGEFISSIPFLPIEINVPDSISWIYDGISGIISGIGQSWPFSTSQTNGNMKSVWKDLKMRNLMPIVVMPLGQPMLPMQV